MKETARPIKRAYPQRALPLRLSSSGLHAASVRFLMPFMLGVPGAGGAASVADVRPYTGWILTMNALVFGVGLLALYRPGSARHLAPNLESSAFSASSLKARFGAV